MGITSREEGKDQESIQSCTIPDGKLTKNTSKQSTQESQEVSPFPAGDHKDARNRQDSIIINTKHK